MVLHPFLVRLATISFQKVMLKRGASFQNKNSLLYLRLRFPALGMQVRDS